MTSADDSDPRFQALALQITTRSVAAADRMSARARILGNIERIGRALAGAIEQIDAETGLPVRLAVLPEYCLTGAPPSGEFADWRGRAAFDPGGAEYEQLARTAVVNDIFLSGNAYEADPHFPGLYFQASFLIGPSGNILLRYRRLISLFTASPYDLLERYIDVYGTESLFPVVATPIGRIAAIASEEILYPEIARCLTMRGAEILLHSTSEMGSALPTAKDIAKRARAVENMAYIISANTAGVAGTALPAQSSTGMSKIVDFEGRVLAAASPGGESSTAHSVIDLGALRSRRRQAGLSNPLVRQPLQAFAASYREADFHRKSQLRDHPTANSESLRATQLQTIERLGRRGLI
ncbi:MAG: nitrilase [Gammaproteobacteria bacterium]|nr:nitrilase [Gammaproteobacteria bacterium]